MTTTLLPPTEPDARADDIEWRQLGSRLWAGRRDGRPAGLIEQGRRFVLVDERSEPVGAYRTLAAAQAAASAPREVPAVLTVPSRRPWSTALLGAAVALGGGLALGGAALTAIAAG